MRLRTGAAAAGDAARRLWCASLGAALAATALATAHAEPGQPAANEVVGYAAADRSGTAASWILPDGAPYLLVPSVGPDMPGGAAVAAVETGSNVGAILFQRPYFAGRDTGCAPELGSDARPDLKWRGATARFVPPVDSPIPGAAEAAERFASLVVYRKDLGPPPGALLLNRRLTIGSRCGSAVHKTYFDRMFVPLGAPPDAARCFNLAGTYAPSEAQDTQIDFAYADRLVLLHPADLDDRYRGLRHRFLVALYDGDGCRGEGAEFHSDGPASQVLNLDQVGLRDRARSIRIAYEGGPLVSYFAAPAPPPVAGEPPVPLAPTEEAGTPPAAAEFSTADVLPPTPAAADPASPPSPPAAPAQSATPPRTQLTAVPPAQSQAPLPSPMSEKHADSSAADAAPSPVALQVVMPAPRLRNPAVRPTAPAPPAASKIFEYPVHEIYRLNYCLHWDAQCGEPAATAWCRANGFAKASAWVVDEDIGAVFPTIVLAEKRVCAQFPCDGFAQITCVN